MPRRLALGARNRTGRIVVRSSLVAPGAELVQHFTSTPVADGPAPAFRGTDAVPRVHQLNEIQQCWRQ